MERIINLTQHPATPEQIAEWVFDLEGEKLQRLKKLLTFDELPCPKTLSERAGEITKIAIETDADLAMIGGAPYFMRYLEWELDKAMITALYSFSRRESIEEKLPDGTVKKFSIFKHIGFVGWD